MSGTEMRNFVVRWRSFLVIPAVALPLAAYAAARYGDTVLSFFFLDDFWLLRAAAGIDRDQGAGVLDVFSPSRTGFMLYRPLTQGAYFYALRKLFGLDAAGYHLAQLVAYVANSVLSFAITRKLTSSWTGATAVAVLYAAAPGHAVAVYWIAAFTMSGTALAVFTTVLWWLSTAGPLRAVGCAILQGIALLCSEHAVVVPLILGIIAAFGPRRDSRAAIARDAAPAAFVVLAYVAAKAWYFAAVAAPSRGYTLHGDALEWLANVARFAAASLNVLTLAHLTRGQSIALGVLIVSGAVGAGTLTAYGRTRWRLAAVGLAIFVVSLLPVLPLTQHYYDYFVGVAALGLAIALVGLCDVISPSWGTGLAAALAVAVVATDVRTCDRAARSNQVLRDVVAGQRAAADLLMSVYMTRELAGSDAELGVGRSPITDYVFDAGRAHEVFFDPPVHISVVGGATRSPAGAGAELIPVLRADPRLQPFWLDPDLDWARELFPMVHRWYLGWCSGCA
jgi:hypothetical protein